MLEIIRTRFINRNVEANIDNNLGATITIHKQTIDLTNQPITLPINLYKLALAIGTIGSVRKPPITKRNKLVDGLAFIENVISNTSGDLQVKRHPDDDIQIKISHRIGEGLSVVVADKLYNLRWSTLSKIPRFGGQSLPDIECTSHLNYSMMWEAKGSINIIPPRVKNHAINQKRRRNANINFASFSRLNQHQISTVEFVDPPSNSNENDNMKNLLLKADHYSKVFNLIGQKKLSEYFNLMRKRILHDTEFPEYNRKNRLFNQIKKNYVRINKKNKTYLGNLEIIDENEYVFIGVNSRLITLKGFLDFVDYPKDINIEENNNSYIITRDGICFAKLTDITFLKDQLVDKVIKHYQETISIRDIDVMNHVALENFFLYLFKKIDLDVKKESDILSAINGGASYEARFAVVGSESKEVCCSR